MFSKLVLRQGVLSRLNILRIPSVSSSHDHQKIHPKPIKIYLREPVSFEKRIKQWSEANEIFFSRERDNINFPLMKQPEKCPPTRLGFLPATWFEAFYEKTGVTGPYLLTAGFLTYCFSKEIIIIEHQFSHFVAFWLAFYYIYRKYGSKLANYLDETSDKIEDNLYRKPIEQMKTYSQEQVKQLEKVIWQEEGQKFLYESKNENVDFQLENAYRKRLAEVYQRVKRRLDYKLEVEILNKNIAQEHMVSWIHNSVIKSITPQQEKETLTKCISDLKNLAKKYAGTI